MLKMAYEYILHFNKFIEKNIFIDSIIHARYVGNHPEHSGKIDEREKGVESI